MSSSVSHPDIHEHKGKSCPVTGQTHEWCPPQPGDSRSPCPALNALANHGYIARDGKNLGALDLIRGLKAGYGLSTPLAIVLSFGGFILLKRFRPVSLYEIGKHGAVEHDASLVHGDTPEGDIYAPTEIHEKLVEALILDAKTGKEQGEGPEAGDRRTLMDATDVARARVRREKSSKPLDALHAEIARGEMAIILGVMERKVEKNAGVPVEWMREWITHERLPKGWKPDHVQGLLNVVGRSKAIRQGMVSIRQAEANAEAEATAKADEKSKM